MRRPDEEALKRALGVQSQSRRQWKAELHYKRALERGGGGGTEDCPLQTIQLHTPVDSKRLCREARVAISTSYAKPQNHSHWVLIYKFKNLSLRISMQH